MATALGEVLGFAVPAVVGLNLLWLFGEVDSAGRAVTFYPLVLLAGMGEGAVLGTAQWVVLHRVLPSLTAHAWVGATAIAAGGAWALGLLPSSVDAAVTLPPEAQAGAWVVIAPVLLCSIGVAQWIVLPHHLDGAGRWIPANVIAWLLGLPVTFIVPALVPDDSPPTVWIAAFVGAGLLMGAIVGAVTGRTLVRLLATHTVQPTYASRSRDL
ncbi:MAG: hypothetical protein AB7R89_13340 [Dehalococcoidia bacterium]